MEPKATHNKTNVEIEKGHVIHSVCNSNSFLFERNNLILTIPNQMYVISSMPYKIIHFVVVGFDSLRYH